MKTVSLTPQEFDNFRKLAHFFFDMYVKNGFVFITANIDHLDALGY
jgi:hypothetical protein